MNTAIQSDHPPGIPNGWFAVAWSKDLEAGEVQRVRYFDRELVLFRTRSGEARVLDAYCPHLGAHIGEGGRVVGEAVRCPFHGWRFDGSGVCVEIPSTKNIPAKARLRSWDVVERNQMILVWHHVEGEPPGFEMPQLPEFGDPNWTDPRYFELEVATHMQDMAENNCDPQHFEFVHASGLQPESEYALAEDGRFFRMRNQIPEAVSLTKREVYLERDTWALGLSSVRVVGLPNAGMLMFSSTSPIDRHHSLSRWVFTVSENLVDIAGEEFIQSIRSGVLEDMRIWNNKIHRRTPVLCDSDSSLAEFRRWARQFYSDSEAAFEEGGAGD